MLAGALPHPLGSLAVLEVPPLLADVSLDELAELADEVYGALESDELVALDDSWPRLRNAVMLPPVGTIATSCQPSPVFSFSVVASAAGSVDELLTVVYSMGQRVPDAFPLVIRRWGFRRTSLI